MFSAALLISFAALWDANKEINVKESKRFTFLSGYLSFGKSGR
jgi:hypothetical protein